MIKTEKYSRINDLPERLRIPAPTEKSARSVDHGFSESALPHGFHAHRFGSIYWLEFHQSRPIFEGETLFCRFHKMRHVIFQI